MRGKKTFLKSLMGSSPLGELDEAKSLAEEVLDGISQLKHLPQELTSRLSEADRDFRQADRVFRGTKIRSKKKGR